MTKISLERIRSERSETLRLVVGTVEQVNFYLAPADKARLKKEAKKRGMSMSLYLNLVLTGQEPPPFR